MLSTLWQGGFPNLEPKPFHDPWLVELDRIDNNAGSGPMGYQSLRVQILIGA